MHDLIVIGGGPSGASAALKGAEMGLDVLLLEKEIFPRVKPCGGAVSERALSYIGFNIPDDLIKNNIYGIRVKYKNKTIDMIKQERIAILTHRDTFDNYLLNKAQAAGAAVRFEKVIDFVEKDNLVHVLTKGEKKHKSLYLIIAEGAQGKLKYKIRNHDNKDQYGLGIVTKIEGSQRSKPALPAKLIELQFGIIPMGYGWIFPYHDYYSVGIAGIACHLKNVKDKLNAYLKTNHISLSNPLKGHIIPLGGLREKLTGKRTLLCGDAGGFLDVLSGEGIAYAIRSGQIAAERIAATVIKKRTDLQTYKMACQAEFEDLKYSHIITKCINKYPDLFFQVFFNDEQVISNFLDIPLMKTTYKQILLSLLHNYFPPLSTTGFKSEC